jgi:hypothetical protein
MKNLMILGAAIIILAIAGCARLASPNQSTDQTSPPVPYATATTGAATYLSATSTAEATETSAPTPAASSSNSTPGRTPISKSTNVILPGVYATKIRLDPPEPKSGPGYVRFYVTFDNTTSKPLQYKWLVKLYTMDDSRHSFGETAALVSNIQPGTSEIASAVNWRTNPLNCLPLTARVFWVNADVSADLFEFKKPDGVNSTATDFQVCPAIPSQ